MDLPFSTNRYRGPAIFSALFTARKRSLRRLCFHRCLSVHMKGGESVSVQGGGSVQGSLCLRGSLSRIDLCPGVSVQGGVLSRGSLSKGGLCQGYPCTVMSGRYASYRNAFLFFLSYLIILIKKNSITQPK